MKRLAYLYELKPELTRKASEHLHELLRNTDLGLKDIGMTREEIEQMSSSSNNTL